MGKSTNLMFSFTIRDEAPFGSAPSPIVLMSLQSAIPPQVALLQCLPPLHRLDSMFHLPAGTVNHHLIRAGEFSTGRTRNFQPELTELRYREYTPVESDHSLRVAEIHAQSILALDRSDRQPVSVPESEPATSLSTDPVSRATNFMICCPAFTPIVTA